MEEYFDPFSDAETLALIRRYERMALNNDHLFFDVDEFMEIIDYYFYKNDYPKAGSCIKRALQQHPDNISLFLKKAQLLINLNKNDRALKVLSEIDKAGFLKKSKVVPKIPPEPLPELLGFSGFPAGSPCFSEAGEVILKGC